MVNYVRLVCEAALLVAIVALTTAAPSPRYRQKYYDQRQTGDGNYRLSIDGVLFAVIPEESLSIVKDSISDRTDNGPAAILEVLGIGDSSTITETVQTEDKPKLENKPLNVVEEKLLDNKPLVEEQVEKKVLKVLFLEQKPLEETIVPQNSEGFKKLDEVTTSDSYIKDVVDKKIITKVA